MKVPELRDGSLGSGNETPKNVDQTKMLDTEAHETVSYSETNDNREFVKASPAFGELGARGRH